MNSSPAETSAPPSNPVAKKHLPYLNGADFVKITDSNGKTGILDASQLDGGGLIVRSKEGIVYLPYAVVHTDDEGRHFIVNSARRNFKHVRPANK